MQTVNESHTIAMNLAQALGEGWTYKAPSEPTYPTAYIAHPDGRELSVFVKGYGADKGRTKIGGVVPSRDSQGKQVRLDSYGPSISVDGSRDAKAIAREVTRRLLPSYANDLAKAQEAVKSANDYYISKENGLTRLQKAAPTILSSGGNHRPDIRSIYLDGGELYGDVRINGEKSCSLELRSVPLDLACEILALIEERYSRKS